jgi:hypothetical protein
MKKKRTISSKEKKEIGLVLGSVLLVAVVAIISINLADNQVEAIRGAAVTLNPGIPTNPGVLILLKDYCGPVNGKGICNDICSVDDRICVPVEENCDFDSGTEQNSCWCCSSP